MTRKLICNATLVRFDEKGRAVVEKNRDICFKNGWIESIGSSFATSDHEEPPEEVYDATGKVAIPGVVNVHHHLFQSVTRCHPPIQNAKLFDWLVTQYRIWAKYTYDDLYKAALVSLGEMMLSGCTCAADMHYLFPRESDLRLEAVMDAAETLGIRIVSGRGSMTMGRSEGGLPPDAVCEDDETALRDCQRVLENFHDTSRGAMRQVALMPCAPFNVTETIMKETPALARQYGALFQTHLAETEDENDYCQEMYGCRPMALMERWGWLGDDVSFAHVVTLNAEEIKLMADTGTGAAHCPSANLRLGSGVAPIADMVDAGVTVGIGVDGSASNDGMHVLGEAKLAVYLQRGFKAKPDALTIEDGLRLATQGGAKLLKRPELGNIAVGMAADIALYDLETIERAGAAAQDPLGSLILGQPPRATDVFVAGQHVVKDGDLASVPSAQLARDLNRLVREKFLKPRPDLAHFKTLDEERASKA